MSKRNAILDAATRLFSRYGFKETSMAELSRITGAAGGTIFHHFKNKEDLFCSSLKNVQKTLTADFKKRNQPHENKTGLARVEHAVAEYLELATVFEDQLLLLHRHYPYQMAETNPKCRACLESVYNCLLAVFEEGIAAGIQDGTVRVSAPRHTAMILFALVDGVVRLHTYKIYHPGAIYQDLMDACRSILLSRDPGETEPRPCTA